MQRAYLLSTFSILSMIGFSNSYGAYVVEASDIHRSASVCEVEYHEGAFGVRDTHGTVHAIPLSLVQGMKDIPPHDVKHILSNHMGWLDVKQIHMGSDSTLSLSFNFRLRGGRPIPKSAVSDYQISSIQPSRSDRDAADGVREPSQAAKDVARAPVIVEEAKQLKREQEARNKERTEIMAEIARVRAELAAERAAREALEARLGGKVDSAEDDSFSGSLCKEGSVAIGATIGATLAGPYAPIGAVGGSVAGVFAGKYVCRDDVLRHVKDDLVATARSGLRTFDEYIRAAALEQERREGRLPSSHSTTTTTTMLTRCRSARPDRTDFKTLEQLDAEDQVAKAQKAAIESEIEGMKARISARLAAYKLEAKLKAEKEAGAFIPPATLMAPVTPMHPYHTMTESERFMYDRTHGHAPSYLARDTTPGAPSYMVVNREHGIALRTYEPIVSERARFVDRLAHSPLTPGYYVTNHSNAGTDRGGMSLGYDKGAGGFSGTLGDRSGGGFEPDRSHGASGGSGGGGGDGGCVVM